MHSIQAKSRNVSECLSHPSIVGGQCYFWPLLVPKPLLGNQGGCWGAVPGQSLMLTFLCTLTPHLQTRLRPSLLLFWCSAFVTSSLTLHFEPASPLHRKTKRITETGEGTTPTPVAQQGCKETKSCNLFSSNRKSPSFPCTTAPSPGALLRLLSFRPKDCPCSSAAHFPDPCPLSLPTPCPTAVIFSLLLLLPLPGFQSFPPSQVSSFSSPGSSP